MLCTVLEECVKQDKEKTIIAFIGAILLKNHNERMSYVQRVFSMLLYSCHCSKQVNYVLFHL